MQRLQAWAQYAAQQLPTGTIKRQQQKQDDDDEQFIYGRVAVYSDDEEPEPGRPTHQQQQVPAAADHAACQDKVQQDQQQLPGLRSVHHLHSHSETDLQELRHQVELTQEAPALIRFDSDDEEEAGTATDWAAFDDPHAKAAAAPAAAGPSRSPAAAGAAAVGATTAASAAAAAGPSISPAAADDSSSLQQQLPAIATPSSSASAAGAAAGSSSGDDGGGGGGSSLSAPAAEHVFEVPSSTSVFDTGEEVPDHDHTQEKRELIIYAIPLTRGKVIFLPVCPWRTDPDAGPGWKKAVAGHVNKVQGEATDIWQKMANAEQGSAVNRLYKFGKRLLENVPAEERLMRGVPKNVSKVIIHHPTQVSPESIMEQMQTMTKAYGIAAVGRAAAATVMLPLAVGVDLIILPGPQVLTYYTMWNLYRNTNGAVGSTRMTKFVTQSGTSANIRVNYAAEPRLDKYHDAANDCPEGVLSEDDIDALVEDLREPDLLEALLSLRAKALRDGNARTSRGGDEYTALPPADAGASPTGFGAETRKSSAAW